MKKLIIFFTISCILHVPLHAQTNALWKGKACAVILTYDDAIEQHLDNALPLLDSLNLKATFYLTASSPGCAQRINEWRNAAREGHELGNHTLYHPCIGNMPGREWVNPEQDLSKYTLQRMLNEIRMTNVFLEALDGKKKRTFAYTCGDMKIGDSSFIEPLKNEFVAARAVRNQMHKLPEIDLYNVDCYVVNGESGEEMISWVKQAVATNSLLVILFHGVNGGNALNVSLPAHSGLLHYLQKNQKDIWVAPMIEVAEYIRAYKK